MELHLPAATCKQYDTSVKHTTVLFESIDNFETGNARACKFTDFFAKGRSLVVIEVAKNMIT